MDLFDDLPEPVNTTEASEKEISSINECSCATLEYRGSHGIEVCKSQDVKVQQWSSLKRKASTVDHDSPPEARRPALGPILQLRGYRAARQGERENMQDTYVLQDCLTGYVRNLTPSIKRLAFYGVFDGHGGARAASYASYQLHANIASFFPKGDSNHLEKDIKRCLIDGFKKTDEEFLKDAAKQKPSWKDGSTAITVLAVDNMLFVANLGDSKAILCHFSKERGENVTIALSCTHSPTQYEERMRIQKAGGYVKDGRVLGVLEVSRSIGDGQFKTCGVICTPDIKKYLLTDDDRFILMACDGLWKAFSADEAVKFINDVFKDDLIKASDTKTLLDMKFETACNKLASEAVRRRSGDNVTIVLISIGNWIDSLS